VSPARPRRLPETTPTKADLAQAIREMRRERSMTTYELAFAADLHPTTMGPIELGKKSPMWDTLCLLSDGLGITVAGLVLRAEHVAQDRRNLPANEPHGLGPPRSADEPR
jgi:DNA-binding XRE family transcriptional regulator